MMAGQVRYHEPGLARSASDRPDKIAPREVGTVRLPDSDESPLPDTELEEAYREMAADAEREREAEEWCEALIGDAIE
jgi:hypothetical protein